MKIKVSIWYKDNSNHLTKEIIFCDDWKLIHEIKTLQISHKNRITRLINYNELIKFETEEIR